MEGEGSRQSPFCQALSTVTTFLRSFIMNNNSRPRGGAVGVGLGRGSPWWQFHEDPTRNALKHRRASLYTKSDSGFMG